MHFKEYLKLIRVHSMGVLIACALMGILSASVVSGKSVEPSIWIGVTVFTAGYHITGFVANEYFDHEIDVKSRNRTKSPLVTGKISKLIAGFTVTLVCTLTLIIAVLLVLETGHYLAFIYLIAMVLLGFAYNINRKSHVYREMFGAGSAGMGILFVATLVLENPHPLPYAVAFYIFIQALILDSVLGALKDVETDPISIPIVLGVRVVDGKLEITNGFKAYVVAICIMQIAMLPIFIMYNGMTVLMIMLFFFSLIIYTVGWDRILNLKTLERKIIFPRFAAQIAFAWIMMVVCFENTLGILTMVTLILLPLIWYITTSKICYGYCLRPNL